MHQLIRILGNAATHDEAHAQALACAENLVERDEFDYYDVHSSRWEESGHTHQLATPLGRLAIAEALQYNRDAFDQALQAARRTLAEFTDEQLYQNDFGDEPRDYYASRHQFAVLGGSTHDCYLYGDHSLWGDKITNDADYAAAIRDIDPEELWVTSLDVHY